MVGEGGKLETWDSLIGLVFSGETGDWSEVHQTMDEARGAVLLVEALRPPRLVFVVPEGKTLVVKTLDLPGVQFTGEPIPGTPRVFWEMTPAGEWRELEST